MRKNESTHEERPTATKAVSKGGNIKHGQRREGTRKRKAAQRKSQSKGVGNGSQTEGRNNTAFGDDPDPLQGEEQGQGQDLQWESLREVQSRTSCD